MQRASRSLRRVLAQAAPARGVAPQTQPAGSAAAAATGGGATKEISPEMQKYLATQPYMFGEKPLAPGQVRKPEFWEASAWMMLLALLALPFATTAVPNGSMQDWARDEAEERIRRRIQGLPVQFGKNYAALRALEEAGYDVAGERGDEE